MSFMCMECFELYHINEVSNGRECSKCNGVVCDIDDMMVLPIITLNQKNLKTMYCCSGHPMYGSSIIPYIMISLSDSYAFDDYLPYMTECGTHRLIINDKDAFFDTLYKDTNFKEVFEHFNNNGFKIEITYHTIQEKLRMTLRYSEDDTHGMAGLDATINNQTYQKWLRYNYKFYLYSQTCPAAISC